MKILTNYAAYEGYYHLGAATKRRKPLFLDQTIRERLKEMIEEVAKRSDSFELVECTVANNHVHILVKTIAEISKVGQVIFGASSRMLRKEYPVLVEQEPKGLWGGTGCRAIKDQEHLENCKSYIRRHQPDNTKIEEWV